MATHFGIRAWRIPWTEEPGGLQSMGSQRVGHNLVTEQQLSYILYKICVMKEVKVLVIQSYPTLCDPVDPTGFSIHGILQARILEWVAISSSRGSP